MSEHDHRVSFREDLRRTLLIYALVSIAVSVLVLLCVLSMVMAHNVVGGCNRDAEKQARMLEEYCTLLSAEAERFANEVDLHLYAQDRSYSAEVNSELFRFVNTNSAGADLYLYDSERLLLFSTEGNSAEREAVAADLYWHMATGVQMTNGLLKPVVSRSSVGKNDLYELFIGHTIHENEGKTAGYVFFAVEGHQLRADHVDAAMTITSRYGSSLYTDMPELTTGFGKLDHTIRNSSGFCVRNGHILYVGNSRTENGEFEVYAIKDCTGILTSSLIILLIISIVFIVFTIFMFFSTDRIARSKTLLLQQISNACMQAEKNDLHVRLDIRSGDEFEVIGDAFNSMMSSIEALMERSMTLAEETTVSRVKQLEAEFNPHFLFNTLENIRFMVRLDPKAATEMIMELSSLLRYSIEKGESTICLSKDLEYIRHYLSILGKRFGERLQCEMTIPKKLENAMIPRLIMQPIIENAVKYGMEARGCLMVRISARLEQECLVLAVEDNGGGIEAETMRRLNEAIESRGAFNGGHMGILNVHERLRLMYGDAYGLTISSTDSGSLVVLRMPAVMKEEEAE